MCELTRRLTMLVVGSTLAVGAFATLPGCEDDDLGNDIEKVGEDISDKADEAGDDLEEAGNDLKREIEDATD